MSEFSILEKLKRRLPAAPRELIAGIGDDCAIYRQWGSRRDLLVTTDMSLEGVHFRSGADLARVGRKAFARALSDIAAMGGEPRIGFVSLSAPSDAAVDEMYTGILSMAEETGTAIAGGDLARTDRILIDVVLIGDTPRGKALRRDGASAGEYVCISGPLGRAASRDFDDMPSPRLELGRKLRLRATACIDVSDGLAIDLYRLCEASNLSVDLGLIPCFPGATPEQALYGGEDYELLWTQLRRSVDVIGEIQPGPPAVRYRGETLDPLRAHDHFAR